MDLLQNPFYILTATPRDDRRRIAELADERSLAIDADACMQARTDLLHPRKRLAAEVAWLPGIDSEQTDKVVALLKSSPMELLDQKGLSALSCGNLFSCVLAHASETEEDEYFTDNVAMWIVELADAFERIDAAEVCRLVNEDRSISAFPEMTDVFAVEAEIQRRRRYYRQVVNSILDGFSGERYFRAMTYVFVSTRRKISGEKDSLMLIDDLIDGYELKVQGLLAEREKKLRMLIEQLRMAADTQYPDSYLTQMLEQIVDACKEWNAVAHPIQLNAKKQGLEHAATSRIARFSREIVAYLANEYGKFALARQLAQALQEVFADAAIAAEHIAEDAKTLDEIAEQRIRANEEVEKWKESITFEAKIGLIFKDRLSLSSEGLEWKGRRWRLEEITALRWSGTKTGPDLPRKNYTIVFGDGRRNATIEFQDEGLYNAVVERFWRAIGARLLQECLEGLRKERTYVFGDIEVDDRGIFLETGPREAEETPKREYYRWEDLAIWSNFNCFCIGERESKNLLAELSYEDEDNVRILETAMRLLWKRGKDRLSSLL